MDTKEAVFLVRLFRSHPERWFSNREIAAEVPSVALRTVRAYTSRFSAIGLLDHRAVFPGYRYRWSRDGEQRNQDYVLRVEEAAEALQITQI